MIVNSEAIVLNSRKYGDSSKIVSLFTQSFGKLSVLAKGARKSKNKFGSSLDPLSYNYISFYHKQGRDLHVLSGSEHYLPLRMIHESFDHLTAALLMAESVSQTMAIEQINQDIFTLFKESLIILNELKSNPFTVSTFFQIHLANDLGFALDFSEILPVPGNNSIHALFSLTEGNFVSNKNLINTFRFELETAALLKDISECDLNKVSEIILTNNDIVLIHDFFINYFSFHLDKKFSYKTFNLFKTML